MKKYSNGFRISLIRLFSSFLNQFLKVHTTWNVCILVNIAWGKKEKVYIKIKLAIIEWNESCFSVIAFLIFKLYWITLGYFFLRHPVSTRAEY